jgi:hypothetical protein
MNEHHPHAHALDGPERLTWFGGAQATSEELGASRYLVMTR